MYRQPYSQIYIHLVWATWDRLPLLTDELREGIYACICAKCKELKAVPITVGGTDDHAHLLARIPTTLAIAELAKGVKGSSSHLATHELPGGEQFKWQGGYGAFSVSKSDVKRVKRYILNQREHHAKNDLDIDLETIEVVEDETEGM